MRYLYNILLVAAMLAVSCRPKVRNLDDDFPTLDEMRYDQDLMEFLDSAAQTAVGPGAKTVDYVKHMVMWNNRLFVVNPDWGGVMELPVDYVPADDEWQRIVSYHGSHVWSPDSTKLISYYAGFQDEIDVLGNLYHEQLTEVYADSITQVLSIDRNIICDSIVECSVRTRNDDGILGYHKSMFYLGRYIEYSASLQYPESQQDSIQQLLEYVDRYPIGPSGTEPVGWCW